jgi:hypothetical protein
MCIRPVSERKKEKNITWDCEIIESHARHARVLAFVIFPPHEEVFTLHVFDFGMKISR